MLEAFPIRSAAFARPPSPSVHLTLLSRPSGIWDGLRDGTTALTFFSLLSFPFRFSPEAPA